MSVARLRERLDRDGDDRAALARREHTRHHRTPMCAYHPGTITREAVYIE